MNKEILKQAFKLKLELMDCITDKLPGPVQETVSELQSSVIKALHEASEEYINKPASKKTENKIKQVSID